MPGPGLEGYLFPDTYRFAPGVPLEEVLGAMVARYKEVWTPERVALREAAGLTEGEMVTLASIVQAEARLQDEMPTIASVYRNRLNRGHLLQADPTVLYALGGPRARLLYAAMDSVADHPYNTYTHVGLPPGPIGSPGLAALDAALSPAETDFFYFVAHPDGTHVFSRTLDQHNRAVAQTRAEWDRLRREQARADPEPGSGGWRVTLPEALRLIVITDEELAAPRSVDWVVEEVPESRREGHTTQGQIRVRPDPARASPSASGSNPRWGALFFVNDRLDIALAASADGVHLGPDDLPVHAARRASPSGFLIGASADQPEVAKRLQAEGADYIGCGAVFPTSTKKDAGEVVGVEGLARVVAAVDIPVVGIGGVDPGGARRVARETTAAGIAVIGAVMAARDPGSAARKLLEPFQGGPVAPGERRVGTRGSVSTFPPPGKRRRPWPSKAKTSSHGPLRSGRAM